MLQAKRFSPPLRVCSYPCPPRVPGVDSIDFVLSQAQLCFAKLLFLLALVPNVVVLPTERRLLFIGISAVRPLRC
ncbi:hypothetical protein L596_016957 [Steinernema carpocapsae]|uniref:Uncharacterized protein n=1 Tax=Steinernema carpocapsae TaxID=34508 RepID=A0A4U5N0F0_STECR|nr:hypothetical protein L596_016957 [Steinernema carpocapsae]